AAGVKTDVAATRPTSSLVAPRDLAIIATAPVALPTPPATARVIPSVPMAVLPTAAVSPSTEAIVAAPSPTSVTVPTEASGEQTVIAGTREAACASAVAHDSDTGTSGQAATDDGADNVKYEPDTNTIRVGEGAATTLAAISRALDQPEALRESAPGEWLLSANLHIEEGAAVRIATPEVRRLKLRSDAGGFVWIKAFGGQLEIARTCVTSWDAATGGYDQNYEDGRAFILARDGARMDIRAAELTHLGYDANESYGVALRLKGTRGEIVDSRLAYNYYGLYSYEASDLVIRGTEVHHSVMYGIDPHTRSNRLLIENNIAHHNGKHGIILAEECSDSVIRNNVSHSNTMHGIVLYQGSDGNIVEGNTAYANGLQGINVNNADDNTIRNNTVYENVEAGIGVGQDAKRNRVRGNLVRANHRDGITLYSDAEQNEIRQNTVMDNGRYGIYLKSENNTSADNDVFGNQEADIYPSGD
ncbi:MAG TPA: right-handed parallel beta-helix repeat-containing protein, partial [Herpetosiphonaceae bacterium]|nr:right-handed parallel beta-helix repeat-containing protein [Herpetosiphonaceae bacterium]